MGKRLLTGDYSNIVFKTFTLPEVDFFNYYSNVIDENIEDNPNIIQELILAINGWVTWYKEHVYRLHVVWESNEDRFKTQIPLFPEFGIRRNVNKAFFDNQIETIQLISKEIRSKNTKYVFDKLQETINSLQKKSLASINTEKSTKGLDCINQVITKLAGTEYRSDKTFLPINLKEHFISLLNQSNVVLNRKLWPNTDWMLFVILKSFIDNSLLNLTDDQIPKFMLDKFKFKGKTDINTIQSNYLRMRKTAKNGSIFNVFTTKLNEVYNNI